MSKKETDEVYKALRILNVPSDKMMCYREFSIRMWPIRVRTGHKPCVGCYLKDLLSIGLVITNTVDGKRVWRTSIDGKSVLRKSNLK